MAIVKTVWCDNPDCCECFVLDIGQSVFANKEKGWIFRGIRGKMHHFCSPGCFKEFQRESI